MLASTPPRVLRFDAFTLDLTRCVLLRGGEELPLRRQSFDVLRYLAEHRGEVVSRGVLIEAVWMGRQVVEDSVVQCIGEIRQALGEGARWVIRTVPSRGYEFMAEVAVEAAPAAAPAPAPPAAAPSASAPAGEAPRPRARMPVVEGRPGTDGSGPTQWQRALIAASLLVIVFAAGGWLLWQRVDPAPPPPLTMMAMPTLAVLPFQAASGDPAEALAARALSDDVVAQIPLQSFGRLISLRSAAVDRGKPTDFKGTGRRLGARYLLLGEVRSEGGETAATIRLVESETGQDVWSHVYRYTPETRKYALAQMTGAGGHVLLAEGRRPLPDRPEAGHLAILAMIKTSHLPNAAAITEALSLLEKALSLDSNSVSALQTFAWAAALAGGSAEEKAGRLRRAQEAVDRAIALAPRDPVGYHRRAQVLRARGDVHGALKASHQAVLNNPLFALGHAEIGRNKIDAGLAHEAIGHIEEALRLSPNSTAVFFWCLSAGRAAVHVGNHEEALRWLQRAQQTAPPGDWDRVLAPWLAMAQAGLGREDEGRALVAEQISAGRLTLARWRKQYPRGSGVLAEQRSRIEELLLRLGVPEGNVQTGSKQ